jgi:hypothetical protein
LVEVMRDTTAVPAARVSAATAILDRGYDRPAQTVHQHVSRHIDDLSDEQLIAIATGSGAPAAPGPARATCCLAGRVAGAGKPPYGRQTGAWRRFG